MLMYKVSCILLLTTTLLSQPVMAAEDSVPDIDLLEFLGTIAGLESMGVDIDLLLDDSEPTEDMVNNNDENDE